MKNLLRRIFPSKEHREYLKMHRRHRKEMIKLAKEGADFDYGYLHDLVVTKIKHMYEYYSAGNNVLQCEESRAQTLETLKHALDLAEELDGLWEIEDENVNVPTREKELYQEFYSYIGQWIMYWWD